MQRIANSETTITKNNTSMEEEKWFWVADLDIDKLLSGGVFLALASSMSALCS